MRTKLPVPDVTEALIQRLLFQDLVDKGHGHIAPNCCALGNEADLLSITQAGFVNEYEIKISRSDFKADKKKIHKHRRYMNANDEFTTQRTRQQLIPSVFYYVVPAGMVELSEVPHYAGLIEVKAVEPRRNSLPFVLVVTKKAPRLHKEKTVDAVKNRITNCLMWKVFNGVTR
jgi:hypothetical protein